jgi:hypothetical protein
MKSFLTRLFKRTNLNQSPEIAMREPPAPTFTFRIGQELYIKYGYSYELCRITRLVRDSAGDIVVFFDWKNAGDRWIPGNLPLEEVRSKYAISDPREEITQVEVKALKTANAQLGAEPSTPDGQNIKA